MIVYKAPCIKQWPFIILALSGSAKTGDQKVCVIHYICKLLAVRQTPYLFRCLFRFDMLAACLLPTADTVTLFMLYIYHNDTCVGH